MKQQYGTAQDCTFTVRNEENTRNIAEWYEDRNNVRTILIVTAAAVCRAARHAARLPAVTRKIDAPARRQRLLRHTSTCRAYHAPPRCRKSMLFYGCVAILYLRRMHVQRSSAVAARTS